MSKQAIVRLQKEHKDLQNLQSPANFKAEPLPDNLFEWYFVIYGLKDCPYEDGYYLGKINFPDNYPHKPPGITMLSESGRFIQKEFICFSFSNFHPELWNPVWHLEAIMIGLISFMNSDEITTGGMVTND